MTEEIKQKLIALNNEQLKVLNELVECFNDVEKRKELDKRYCSISRDMGDILYDEKLDGKNYNDEDYYSIPEIRATLDEKVNLDLMYWKLKEQEK